MLMNGRSAALLGPSCDQEVREIAKGRRTETGRESSLIGLDVDGCD
jgi:hypothetical protein